MATIRVLRPDVPENDAPSTPRARRTPVDGPAVLTIIENGKPNARALLQLIGGEVGERTRVSRVDTHSKPTAARPIDVDEARMLAARSHLVITGLGD